MRRRSATRVPLAGLLVNENTTTGNVIVGSRTDAGLGRDRAARALRRRHARRRTDGVRAGQHAGWRPRIYAAIAAAAGSPTPRTRVLDLYCGVGGIALTLARRRRAVLGIEEVEAAVVAARANAERAGSAPRALRRGPRRGALGAHRRAGRRRHAEPARKGCGERVGADARPLAPPRLLYLSCHPESFARDAGARSRRRLRRSSASSPSICCRRPSTSSSSARSDAGR